MILQALNRYYEALVVQGKLSRLGWDDSFKVSFALELNDDGELVNVYDLRTEQANGKKTVILPRQMRVPAHVKRSSGISANFLCDNSGYMLGVDEKGKPERSAKCFEACGELHRSLLTDVDSPAARAILRFFETWDPAGAPTHPLLAPRWKDLMANANLIFFYGGRFATDDAAICDAWQRCYDQTDPSIPTGQCLITGTEQPVAAVHPAIKGVRGAQSSGAALVSFNALAFCSYGHEQNYNAPVGVNAAFAYTTALNYLLADREHCRMVGDTTVVCWAEHGGAEYQDLLLDLLFGPEKDAVNAVSDDDLAGYLKDLAECRPIRWRDWQLDPGEHIYFLGLSPNSARISVRFFLEDTLQTLAERIDQHYEDIRIVRPSFDKVEYLPMWRLAAETVNQNSRDKSALPQLAGDLYRAVLMGTPYPATLLNGVQLRIRAEREITRGRAAIIKGYYNRFYRDREGSREKEVFTVELNEQSTYQPYVLGRLFSVLEALQEAANPGINATIRDKYFNSAAATPGVVFPLLISLGQKHLKKLKEDAKVYYDKQITGLMGMLDKNYPARMTLSEQGAFQIGYYHQTQKRFTKKEDK